MRKILGPWSHEHKSSSKPTVPLTSRDKVKSWLLYPFMSKKRSHEQVTKCSSVESGSVDEKPVRQKGNCGAQPNLLAMPTVSGHVQDDVHRIAKKKTLDSAPNDGTASAEQEISVRFPDGDVKHSAAPPIRHGSDPLQVAALQHGKQPVEIWHSNGSKQPISSMETASWPSCPSAAHELVNASVVTKYQGATFYIGANATVCFQYGANIGRSNKQHRLDTLIEELVRSHNAEYDMIAQIRVPRGPCTPGTRIEVLNELVQWCNTVDQPIYWMNGMAGTGKTTLMYSLCRMLHRANLLSASFFCARFHPECRDVALIIPSIAFQLARQYPTFATELARILRLDPDVLRRGMDAQLLRLIIDPWKSSPTRLPEHTIVVIEALDECDRHHDKFLQAVFDHATKLPFKILITSRPEIPVRDIMLAQNSSILSTMALHDIDPDIVREDILTYLRSRLSHRIAMGIINDIADLAGSLFIYAATVAELFVYGRVNIRECIHALQVSSFSNTTVKSTVMATLDELYLQILAGLLTNSPIENDGCDVKVMLHTVACVREPLTRKELTVLLGIDEDEIARRLDLLRSVLVVSDDPDQPITIFHSSFLEFILDSSRSKEFACEAESINLLIGTHCMRLMDTGFHPNHLKLDEYSLTKSTLSEVALVHNYPTLRYAATYFTEHWVACSCTYPQEFRAAIHHFLMVHLLCWLECLSVVGCLAISVRGLETILSKFHDDRKLASLVYDALRLVQLYYDDILQNPVISHSAFAWIPLKSLYFSSPSPPYPHIPRVLCGLPSKWMGPDRTINIHSEKITSILVSLSAEQIISGSADKTIRVWDLRNQLQEHVLIGHTDKINSLSLFKDGTRVASASDDGTVRIWNIIAEQAMLTLNSSSRALTVAISSNEQWIASGHSDGFIRIWNAATASLLRLLKGNTDLVQSIAFIPHSSRLVSASDETARIWNLRTGKPEHVLLGHENLVCAVACSPDGSKIITSSFDNTARVWSALGNQLQILRGHVQSVICATFLADGKRAVTGSDDDTLRIWDVSTGDMLHTLARAGEVESVAIVSGGDRIVSCSASQINLWSLRGETLNVAMEGDRGAFPMAPILEAKSMSFSSDGRTVLLWPCFRILDTVTLEDKATQIESFQRAYYSCGILSVSGNRVAAATWVGDINIWSVTDDERTILTLQGHSNLINSISFSHDERKLVSAADDGTARIWDGVKGSQLHALDHPWPGTVWDASYSHNDKKIVSSSSEHVHIWDAQTGAELQRFELSTLSVVFSPDDQQIIASYHSTTVILDVHSIEDGRFLEGYHFWTTFEDGSSYALHDDGWVYCSNSAHSNSHPHRLFWIPLSYRPQFDYEDLHGPLFTSSPRGIQLCVPRQDGLVTLLIPDSH